MANVTRRGFLKGVGAGLIAVQAPIKLLAEYPVATTFAKGEFIIDTSARTIQHVGDEGFSIIDMYRFIKEQWRDEDQLIAHPFPMMAIHPEYAMMENDWSVTDDSFAKMHGGCLELQNGDRMTSCIALGNMSDHPDARVHVVQDGKPLADWVGEHGVVRVTKDIEKLTFVQRDPGKLYQSFDTGKCGYPHAGGIQSTIRYPMFITDDLCYG